MHWLAAAVFVASVFFHTDAQLASWLDDWQVQASSQFTPQLLEEWQDMHQRHPCQLGQTCIQPETHRSEPRSVSNAGRGMGNGGSDVERWRGLVSEFFPADRVDKALAVLRCESGGNPNADNPRSTAAGLFQFLRSTWDKVAIPLGYGSYDSGAVYDPRANTHAASVLSKQGSTWAAWSCG